MQIELRQDELELIISMFRLVLFLETKRVKGEWGDAEFQFFVGTHPTEIDEIRELLGKLDGAMEEE